MRKIIQVLGSSGSGKTVSMREAIRLAGDYKIETVPGKTKPRSITVTPDFVVLGDYDKSGCSGVDRFDGYDDLLCVIQSVFEAGFENVIFEGMIYSQSFKLVKNIIALAASYGYEYSSIFLDVDYVTAMSRVYGRNRGKAISEDNMVNRVLSIKVVQEKVRRLGHRSIVLDTEKMTPKEIGLVIYGELT